LSELKEENEKLRRGLPVGPSGTMP